MSSSTSNKTKTKQAYRELLASLYKMPVGQLKAISRRSRQMSFQGFVVRPGTTMVYYFVELLGEGAFGAMYSAISSNELGKSGEVKYVVKMFALNGDTVPQKGAKALRDPTARQFDEYEFRAEFAIREFEMSRVINRRLGTAFCEQNVVCATESINLTRIARAYVVFPFVSAQDLRLYLVNVLYPSMLFITQEMRRNGFPDTYTVNDVVARYTQLRDTMDDEQLDLANSVLQTIVPPFVFVQTTALAIAFQVVSTVAMLHNKHIFHRDIKAENLLILRDKNGNEENLGSSGFSTAGTASDSNGDNDDDDDDDKDDKVDDDRPRPTSRQDDNDADTSSDTKSEQRSSNSDNNEEQMFNTRARLIDLGLACAGDLNGDAQFRGRQREMLLCKEKYNTTPLYRDPLVSYVQINDDETSDSRDPLLERDAKFDTYATGKVLQRLFDPKSITLHGRELYPVVRDTQFMPLGMVDIIESMTGEMGYITRKSKPRLNREQRVQRMYNYYSRPTLAEIIEDLAGVVERV